MMTIMKNHLDTGICIFLHLSTSTRHDRLPAVQARKQPFGIWVFVDESGNLWSKSDSHVVIAAVATTRPENLMRVVRETRQERRLPRAHTLHATEDPAAAVSLLSRLASLEEASTTVVALNREWYWRPDLIPTRLYQALAVYVLRRALDASTIPSQRALVVMEVGPAYHSIHVRKTMASALGLAPEQVSFARKNSKLWGDHIQCTDAVAWAYFQALARGRGQYAELVSQLADFREVGVDNRGEIRPVTEMEKHEH